MAGARKYEGLPDIDAAAPDIYETPDLADDVSTLQETSAQSPSDSSDADEGASESSPADSRVDRRHTKANKARSKFQPSRVNADDVDFSDRLNLNRKSYRAYNRRRPGQYDDDPEELGDFSDDEETLDQKLTRLRHEVEQLKVTLEEQKESAESKAQEELYTDVLQISDQLDAITTERRGGTNGAHPDFRRTVHSYTEKSQQLVAKEKGSSSRGQTIEATDHSQLLQTLSKAAEFDSRLNFLENALGLSGSTLPDSSETSTKLILPTLGSLEQLVGTATAQPTQLEAAQLKTRQLLKDAERLSKLRVEQSETGQPPSSATNGENGHAAPDNQEQLSKINAIYGILPTIDSLSPSLPLLLDRLRTLRLLHSGAAEASSTLDDLEKAQEEQDDEIEQWRNALGKVEASLSEGQDTLSENMENMSAWVKELEGRIGKT
ncbi:hypothetical protein BT63DRAFT_474310 [Microthyrium microscopicum]|uniref:Uncharacterized protein n=1 Tax=Microthyrium microscopicum TaxID=703497 RepID=A0A6A6UT26_9PEZI|nr:hypothetical protein BT63DRAFT_474310 [Microthyrium microscopicum]